jgi:hypothetical protein
MYSIPSNATGSSCRGRRRLANGERLTTKPERPYAIIDQGTIFDGVAYWATLVGVSRTDAT